MADLPQQHFVRFHDTSVSFHVLPLRWWKICFPFHHTSRLVRCIPLKFVGRVGSFFCCVDSNYWLHSWFNDIAFQWKAVLLHPYFCKFISQFQIFILEKYSLSDSRFCLVFWVESPYLIELSRLFTANCASKACKFLPYSYASAVSKQWVSRFIMGGVVVN